MSSTRTTPCLPAWPSAASDAARTVGVDRCVPVISNARQPAMKSSRIAAASIAMSAQFSRRTAAGRCRGPSGPAAPDRSGARGSTCTCDVSQPSRCKVSTQEAAHLLVADARDHRRAQAQPRNAEGDVGRAAAEVLGEARHVLEPRADLLRVEVDGQTTEASEVETAGSGESQTAHTRSRKEADDLLHRAHRQALHDEALAEDHQHECGNGSQDGRDRELVAAEHEVEHAGEGSRALAPQQVGAIAAGRAPFAIGMAGGGYSLVSLELPGKK